MISKSQSDIRTGTYVGFLECISLERIFNDEGADCSLKVVLLDGLSSLSTRTIVLCRGVTSLKLGDLVASIALQLAIYDIADRGLESERFRVVDDEGGAISLNCVAVEITG